MRKSRPKIAQAVLGITIVVGFFIILALYLTGKVDKDNQVSLLLVGSLSASFGAIVQFYFGSSASSSEKNELLAGRNPYLNATNTTFHSGGISTESDSQSVRYKEHSNGSYYRESTEISRDSGTGKRILRRKTASN